MKHRPSAKLRNAVNKETGRYLGFPLYQAAVQDQVKKSSFYDYGYGLRQSSTTSPYVHGSEKEDLYASGRAMVNERNTICSFMEGTRDFHADKFHKQYLKDNHSEC